MLMFNKKYHQLSCVFFLCAVAVLAYGANFTYDGINRRDPRNDLERNTIDATGEIFCKDSKTGRQLASTGFFLILDRIMRIYC